VYYFDEKPLYQQIKEIRAAYPNMSYNEAKSKCIIAPRYKRGNSARPRLQGSSEVARRQRQVTKGFIKVN
jgi:hypothetical protein